MSSTVIELAAGLVALSESAVTVTAPPLGAAIDHAQKIQGRIDAITIEREQIRSRRAAGEHQPDDAGRIALLDMDAASLREMLPDADARVSEAQQAHQVASATLLDARRALEAAEAWVLLDALRAHALKLVGLTRETLERHREAASKLRVAAELEHAQQSLFGVAEGLDAALLAAMTSIQTLGGAFGADRPAWATSEELALAVRRADGGRQYTYAARGARAA